MTHLKYVFRFLCVLFLLNASMVTFASEGDGELCNAPSGAVQTASMGLVGQDTVLSEAEAEAIRKELPAETTKASNAELFAWKMFNDIGGFDVVEGQEEQDITVNLSLIHI